MQVVLNGEPCELPGPITIKSLLEQLELAQRPVAVEVNLQLVPREQHATRALIEGDRLEVVTLVGGG